MKDMKNGQAPRAHGFNRLGSSMKRRPFVFLVGGAALGAVGLFAGPTIGIQLASSTATTVGTSSLTPNVAADQAATNWANTNAPGTGQVVIVKTESDTEGALNTPVFDVKLIAANANTYSITVQASNDAILSAHLAENSISPTSSTVAPTSSTVAPTSSTVAPTSSTVAPTSSTVAPTSSTVAPTSSTVAPTSSTVAPTSSTVAPSLLSTISGADQAATSWVNANAPGAGSVQIIKTEPDTEGSSHIPVFDVNVIGGNGHEYAVTVAQANDAVINAHLTESQPKVLTSVDKSKTSSSDH
ncbi:hypothetical protein [Acidithrix ferrooxidans]|uniref:Peptidase propeptide and YPEB domain protein n=1 Tax=Acidithrix ferrooxidans TaxID=1280514 RepID=A0A0D8HJJ9_9ACTN|nr:hypothetical protein [Acidithrix ferrooxidans]KJF18039.1 hypothetical protein AXFE_11380 [Acidithrix ferrooxidans]